MSIKINKAEILREILRTLIAGWGKGDVLRALEHIETDHMMRPPRKGSKQYHNVERPSAAAFVKGLPLEQQRREIIYFAEEFDKGRLLSNNSDIRRFLEAHGVRVKEIRSRNSAFRQMLPILVKMSDKGLLREIGRSRLSGPAGLGDISDAIRETGESVRRDYRQS